MDKAESNSPPDIREEIEKPSAADRLSSSAVPRYRIKGDGPLLVYVAGLDGTGEMLFKQAPELSRSYRVVTYRSRDSGRFTYEDLADDVAAIIENTRERRATIVAESFGGGVALTFALRHPSLIERLALVNTFSRFRQRVKIHLAARLASIVPFSLLCYARNKGNAIGLLVDNITGEDRERFFDIISTVEREGYARRLQLISELDLDDRLSEIEAPTLIIAGEKDLLIRSVREARLMAARMPNATVKVVKGAGHACLLGSRVNLARILADWSFATVSKAMPQ